MVFTVERSVTRHEMRMNCSLVLRTNLRRPCAQWQGPKDRARITRMVDEEERDALAGQLGPHNTSQEGCPAPGPQPAGRG